MESKPSLLELNRPLLKKIFDKHCPLNQPKVSLPELQKICKSLDLIPVTFTQTLISLGTIRLLATKTLSITSISKAYMNYAQFEEILKSIAYTAFNAAGSSSKDRVRLFFSHIASPAKSAYQSTVLLSDKHQSTPQPGRPSSKSLAKGNRASFSQNDSLVLDQNIQEALKTLKRQEDVGRKGKTRSSSRESTSHVLRHSHKGVPDYERSMKKKPEKNLDSDISNQILADHLELQEFLEMEKQVQGDIVQITVNLGKTVDKSGSANLLRKNLGKVTKKPKPPSNPLVNPKEKFAVSASLETPKETKVNNGQASRSSLKKVKPHSKTEKGDKGRQVKLRRTEFSNALVLRFIFFAWKSLHLLKNLR